MKQVIFRGKTKDTNEWVFGSLLQSEVDVNGNSNCTIVTRFASFSNLSHIDVQTKTVGFYSGIKDVKQKQIFIGDKVRCYKNGTENGNTDVIEFNFWCAWLRYRHRSVNDFLSNVDEDFEIEIFGNIHG